MFGLFIVCSVLLFIGNFIILINKLIDQPNYMKNLIRRKNEHGLCIADALMIVIFWVAHLILFIKYVLQDMNGNAIQSFMYKPRFFTKDKNNVESTSSRRI